MPDIPARINSDPVQASAEPIAAAVQVAQGPAAPPAIDVGNLIQIMTVIDNLQPGVSVAELRDAIARNPDQVSRLLAAYGGERNDVPLFSVIVGTFGIGFCFGLVWALGLSKEGGTFANQYR
jgi:hypothetical protein